MNHTFPSAPPIRRSAMMFRLRPAVLAATVFGCALIAASSASAQKIQMNDGRIFQGKMLPITGIADNPTASSGPDGETKATPILLIDNGLRRVYVPKRNFVAILDQAPERTVKFNLWQRVAQSGSMVGSVGPSIGVTPFDEHGRRIYEMQTNSGPLAVVQGITELTPRYAKVEGLLGSPRSIVWSMSVATSSIPRDTLAQILANAVSQDDPQQWLEIVRFYLQAERYRDARRELEKVIAAHPDMQDLSREVRQLQQMHARRLLEEIQLRRSAGQHELVGALLETFPTEDVAGETLQQVREALDDYQSDGRLLQATKEQLQHIAGLLEDDRQVLIEPILDEILQELNFNNLDRLQPFQQLADDESLEPEQRIAIAISGWLMGGADAVQTFTLATSLVNVRELVLEYLREPLAFKRDTILGNMRSLEGASVERVARIVAHILPPWDLPEESELGYGAYFFTAQGQSENGDFDYVVQLPPEYDPYRKYPTLVVLNGAFNSPEQELEFWTGLPPVDEEGNMLGPRVGQSMRHGYIVMSIVWKKPQQYVYEQSLREHEAVLTCLRDAFRRFSIDTDRVFLSGHGTGGDAAWDFAQSHPDLWAGVIPFLAQFDQEEKFVQHYWENAAYVPLYFVSGELDGVKVTTNAQLWNRYMQKGFDATVVEFHGRGYEPLGDEIHEVFDWMGRLRRNWPTSFECKTMRPWDNFFWWVEARDFPNAVTPGNWSRKNARPSNVVGQITTENRLVARTAAAHTIVWLSPDVVDFAKPIQIVINRKRITDGDQPDLSVLLEDVRTRADRQRPFWAKVEFP